MARQLRILEPGLTYHVWARGNGKMTIYTDDEDRRRFLDLMGDVADRYEVECLGYCQMNTHYHAVLTTRQANLSGAVQRLNGSYALWWNRRHDHVGHVFQGRFSAQIVQDEAYLLTVCRYVVMNPVVAGRVKHPHEWPWSSYRATAGLEPPAPFLNPNGLWRRLGCGDVGSGIRGYRRFIDERVGEAATLPHDRILGDAAFVERLAKSRQPVSPEVPIVERVPRPDVSSFFPGAATRRDRGRRAALACRAGFSLAEVARYLGVHYATVSRMIEAGKRPG
jgi:putative transposase